MEEIGVIKSNSGIPLLKMWRVLVPEGKREFRPHSHVQFEISLIEEGSAIYTVGKREYKMTKGSMFVFCSNEQHCITDIAVGGLKLINLQFEPRYLWGNSVDSLSEQSVSICFTHNKAFENKIEPDMANAMREYFLNIKNELIREDREYHLNIKSYLNLMLVTLIRDFNYAKNDTSLSRDKLRAFSIGVKYIDKHLNEKISLNELSKAANMNPNYFCTLFHSVSGTTVIDYINIKRIDNAKYLLYNENKNILEIALESGFNNTAHFNKIFKRHTGMTPRDYRKNSDIMF